MLWRGYGNSVSVVAELIALSRTGEKLDVNESTNVYWCPEWFSDSDPGIFSIAWHVKHCCCCTCLSAVLRLDLDLGLCLALKAG